MTENISSGDYGVLVVQVSAAGRAQPLSGVTVTVSEPTADGEELIKIMNTDANGMTEPLQLPAPPSENSESPGGKNLYCVYNIRTDFPGYYTIENVNVPVFANRTAIQPIAMIPLPESVENGKKIIYIEQEPTDLE